jgi:hypothetical protein
MRPEHEIAGEASNHPSGQLNHLGALDADTTDAGPERTLWYRRRTVNADDQFDAAVNDQNLAVASRRLTQPTAQFLVDDRFAAMTRDALRGWTSDPQVTFENRHLGGGRLGRATFRGAEPLRLGDS